MNLNILIASPEAIPFAKTGGLADVAGALPVALKSLGCNVAVMMPYYRQVAQGGFEIKPTGVEATIPIGQRRIKAQVLESNVKGIPVYFIKREEFYDRSYLYGTPEGDYFDNLERYAFFSRAVLEAAKALGFRPEIIHCNDWQTGLIPAYLKNIYQNDLFYHGTATVFTIHNMAYQGLFPSELFWLTGLGQELMGPDGMEFWGRINLLKSGLVYSEMITTVSEAYSREIQTPEFGWGLEGVLKNRRDDLVGVLNGIDYDEWDPEKDPLIPENYSPEDLKGKQKCKRAALKEFGLKLKVATPLIGIISRLADQKGLDILSEAMPDLMQLDIGMIVLGSGDRKYQVLMEDLAKRYHERLSVRIAFSNGLAHLVEAGCDMLLMPSRYEPCGLNQIYSLRYGTIPIVRATGGLDDTVKDYEGGRGNGFKFSEYSSTALVEKVKEAIGLYNDDKKAWKSLQRKMMLEEFSWAASARKYMEIYRMAEKKLLKI